MIPDEAVEAAWDAMMKNAGLRSLWSNASPEWWERYRASMRAALEAAAPHMLSGVTALADDWERQGEYDMAYSKTVADQEVAIQLLQAGAQMVDDARLVRNAIGTAT